MTDKPHPNESNPTPTLELLHGRQVDQRREASRAFTQEQSRGLTTQDLHSDQLRQDRQLSRLDDELERLRKSVRSAQLLCGLLITVLIACGVIAWYRPDWIPQRALAEKPGDANQAASESSQIPSQEMVFEEDFEFKIRTDVDRKYQRLVRELYEQASLIRFPEGEIEDRVMATDYYLDIMITTLSLLERASQEGVSSEISTAIINILEIAKATRRVRFSSELSASIRDRNEQVEMVLRAPDVRAIIER